MLGDAVSAAAFEGAGDKFGNDPGALRTEYRVDAGALETSSSKETPLQAQNGKLRIKPLRITQN